MTRTRTRWASFDGAISRYGRSYTGEPDRITGELAKDAAVQAADMILPTVPSQLAVDYNAAMLETIALEIALPVDWSPNKRRSGRSGLGWSATRTTSRRSGSSEPSR